MVSPLNNINHNIAEIDPLYFPFNSITSLLPSFLRKVVSTGLEIKSHDTELVAEAFNISTFFEPFLKDFGYMLLPFVLVVFSMVSVAVMHKASNKVMYVFILAVMLHSITLSVFANFFTHLVFVFQMVIPIFIFKLKVR
jgi:oligosaccharide repeat unit polymerase